MTNDVALSLANLADVEGLDPRDVVRFPDLIARLGVAADSVTSDVVERAHRLFRKAITETKAKARPATATTTTPAAGKTVRKRKSKAKAETADQKAAEPKAKRKVVRAQVFGFAVTAVLRWMGKNGWNFEDAGVALAEFGAGGIADNTIRIQLAAGRKGERGEPASLTKAQIKQLKAARQ